MQIILAILSFIVGACIGSFLCCQARRLHLKATKGKKLGNRSVCLKCKTKLKWYDNIPIVSWLALKGKCRKCGKKIGAGELISELLAATSFLLLSFNLNLENHYFLITFILLIINLLFLAIYDGLYGELPTTFLITAIIFAAITALVSQWPDFPNLIDYLLSVAILGGTYLALYLVSKGKWVGDGDWLLGVALGLLLGSPWLALIALFLSNFLACLVMLPLIKGKNHKIPFGPFLVAATITILSFHDFLKYGIINLW